MEREKSTEKSFN